jgi:hypothetical protein
VRDTSRNRADGFQVALLLQAEVRHQGNAKNFDEDLYASIS